jgi:hypothetical protein
VKSELKIKVKSVELPIADNELQGISEKIRLENLSINSMHFSKERRKSILLASIYSSSPEQNPRSCSLPSYPPPTKCSHEKLSLKNTAV